MSTSLPNPRACGLFLVRPQDINRRTLCSRAKQTHVLLQLVLTGRLLLLARSAATQADSHAERQRTANNDRQRGGAHA